MACIVGAVSAPHLQRPRAEAGVGTPDRADGTSSTQAALAHKKFEAHFAVVAGIHGAQPGPFCPVLDSSWRSMRGDWPRLEPEVDSEKRQGA